MLIFKIKKISFNRNISPKINCNIFILLPLSKMKHHNTQVHQSQKLENL